jgi:hypothetical protein
LTFMALESSFEGLHFQIDVGLIEIRIKCEKLFW